MLPTLRRRRAPPAAQACYIDNGSIRISQIFHLSYNFGLFHVSSSNLVHWALDASEKCNVKSIFSPKSSKENLIMMSVKLFSF